jgi:membrane-bound metal-dependent hydrolase YbcI (DUF457 family)
MALLADLDQHGSCASRSLGPLSEGLSWVIHKICLGHRGMSHTWLGIVGFTVVAEAGGFLRHDWAGKAILGLLVMIAATGALEALHILRSGPADVAGAGIAAAVAFWGWDLSLIMIAAPLGVAIHICGDELTEHGCQFLRPFSQHAFHLLPKCMQISTGHAAEHFVITPIVLVLIGALAAQAADPALMTAGWHFAASRI